MIWYGSIFPSLFDCGCVLVLALSPSRPAAIYLPIILAFGSKTLGSLLSLVWTWSQLVSGPEMQSNAFIKAELSQGRFANQSLWIFLKSWLKQKMQYPPAILSGLKALLRKLSFGKTHCCLATNKLNDKQEGWRTVKRVRFQLQNKALYARRTSFEQALKTLRWQQMMLTQRKWPGRNMLVIVLYLKVFLNLLDFFQPTIRCRYPEYIAWHVYRSSYCYGSIAPRASFISFIFGSTSESDIAWIFWRLQQNPVETAVRFRICSWKTSVGAAAGHADCST